MATIKNPLLSLASQGTLANALTFQRTRGRDTARKKPRLPYSRTLAQQYQRWDYQDYLAWWGTLTLAQKRVYSSLGSRSHNTALGAFLREKLSTLPDLAARYHLDEIAGAVAHDSSKNGNDAVIHGATPCRGQIAGAFRFDGLNDYLDLGAGATLNLTNNFTYMARVRLANGKRQLIFGKGSGPIGFRTLIFYKEADNSLAFDWTDDNIAPASHVSTLPGALDDNWHLVAATFKDGRLRMAIDKVQQADAYGDTTVQPSAQTYIGKSSWIVNWPEGDIDAACIYNRELDMDEIFTRAERRYP